MFCLDAQIELLATTSIGDFYNEPPFKYLLPDEEMRRRILPGLIRHLARSCQVFGEIYSTENIDAGVVCISGGDAFNFERLFRTAILPPRFKLDWTSFRRCISLCARMKNVQDRLVRGPHRHLIFLGLKPSKVEKAATLLQPLLSRADADGIPCYLETFREEDLPFYKDFGFRIKGAGRIPAGGPSFWALMRAPR